jgi:serpin B
MKQLFTLSLLTSLIFAYTSCNKSVSPLEEPDPKEQTEPKEQTGQNEPPEPAKPILLTTKQAERASIDNRFAFTIFKEVSASEGTNTFFSPLSLSMALGMLYNGTSGDTRTEMAQVLGMANFTDAEINEYYQKMMQALLSIDPLTDISIANSIWYRNILPVKQPFIDINQTYFDAMVTSLDFSKPNAADIINKWCADKTKDKIKEIIAKPIPDEIVMYLMNALYFKSKWQHEFEKKNTKTDDFTIANGTQKRVNMMEQTTSLPYYADNHLQCVEMPYGNQAFSMVAILPSDDMDIEQIIDYLDDVKWNSIVSNMFQQNVWLKLPRFKVECELLLNDPVMSVGMKHMFEEDLADFEKISDWELFVSFIKQKTYVEVNEEGTEAAAVTVIGIGITSVGPSEPQSIPFHANRPFLYLIKEKSTGAILFIGRMDEPIE